VPLFFIVILLSFVDYVSRDEIVRNHLYEKCHTAVVTLDNHTDGNIWVTIKCYVVLTFRTDAAEV